MLNSQQFFQDTLFDSLEVTDQIIINTQNSQYQSDVINPTSQSEKLSNSQHPTLCLFTSRGDKKNINLETRLIPPQKVAKSFT